MRLSVYANPQKISTQNIRYLPQKDYLEQRQYDACFYELNIDPTMSGIVISNLRKKSQNDNIMIYFNITRNMGMNVYLYAGRNRFSANESIIEGNGPAKVDQNYYVDAEKGMLVVAFPEEGEDTLLEFNIWIGPGVPLIGDAVEVVIEEYFYE